MGSWTNKQSHFLCHCISSCTENHQKSHSQDLWNSPLMPHQRNLRLQWSQKYMTLDMSCVLFTEEKGRLLTDLMVGQMVGSLSEMSVTNIYDMNIRVEESCCGLVSLETDVGPVIVPEVFKVITATYCNLLKEVMGPWLDYIPPSLLRILSIHVWQCFFLLCQGHPSSYSIDGKRLMVWPPASLDLGSQPYRKSLVEN